jgi:translation initiation factor 1 (eIF-1/SUI1)
VDLKEPFTQVVTDITLDGDFLNTCRRASHRRTCSKLLAQVLCNLLVLQPEDLQSSVSAQERAAKDAAKKEAKAAANEARDSERKAASKILIKRVERNKRKFVTVVIGLEVFGLENKKIAKDPSFLAASLAARSCAETESVERLAFRASDGNPVLDYV